LAAEAEESSFVKYALTGLGSYPSYYKYMADINRRGPDILGGVPRLASLTALSVRNRLDNEAVLIDARKERDFNLGHVPGSYAIPHCNAMATWVGWVVPSGQPLVLLSADAGQHDDIMRQLIRIGFDRVHGFLSGGIDAWKSAGLPIEESNRLDLDDLKQAQDLSAAPMVIDVRQRNEYDMGHISGALNIELGELQEHLDGLPREMPLVTVCAAGMRATTAGRILQRDGRDNVQVVDEAGTPAWIERGYPSETGEGRNPRKSYQRVLGDLLRTGALTANFVESHDFVGPSPLLLPRKDGRGNHFLVVRQVGLTPVSPCPVRPGTSGPRVRRVTALE